MFLLYKVNAQNSIIRFCVYWFPHQTCSVCKLEDFFLLLSSPSSYKAWKLNLESESQTVVFSAWAPSGVIQILWAKFHSYLHHSLLWGFTMGQILPSAKMYRWNRGQNLALHNAQTWPVYIVLSCTCISLLSYSPESQLSFHFKNKFLAAMAAKETSKMWSSITDAEMSSGILEQ